MFPRSGEDDVESGEVFPSVKNQGIEPEGGPRNTMCSAPAYKKTNLHTQRDQGVVKPLTVRRKIETAMENYYKVVEVSDLKFLDQKRKQKRSKAI
jgi:hypothetical protein